MINFFYEIEQQFSNESPIKNWINTTVEEYNFSIETLNFIFCDDAYLLALNKQFLDHDYYTDILTFDNSISAALASDIYISIERVKDNAQTLNEDFFRELLRVIIHGVLHLMGFKDQSKTQKEQMRIAENTALKSISFNGSTWNEKI